MTLEAEMNGHGLIQIQVLAAGVVLGLSWLFPPYIGRFHARAVQRTVVTFYEGGKLRELCENNRQIGYELMRRVSELLLVRLQWTREELMKFYLEKIPA